MLLLCCLLLLNFHLLLWQKQDFALLRKEAGVGYEPYSLGKDLPEHLGV